jgi:D-alanyl-D-alanine carboxypeptidase
MKTTISQLLILVLCIASSIVSAQELTIKRAVDIEFPTEAGKLYQVQFSNDMSGPWLDQGEPFAGTGGVAQRVLVTLGQESGFFRLNVSGEPRLPQAKKDRINAHLAQAVADFDIPGIVAGIWVGSEEPWFTSRGVANVETQEPLTTEHRFRIGSASKTFVAMATMQLIDEGKIRFDDSVSRFLTKEERAALSDYDLDTITVRMLLRHTSGIASYTSDIPNWFVPYILDRTRVWADLELLTIGSAPAGPSGDPEVVPLFSPGSAWSYSNTNYVLLGMIVERVTGNWIGTELTNRFFDPLGLTQTRYPAPGQSEIQGDKVAHGYMDWRNNLNGEASVPAGLMDVTVYDTSGVGSAGPITSTVGDLLTWIRSIAHGGDLIGDLSASQINWNYFRATGVDNEGMASDFSYGMGLAHEDDSVNKANYYLIGHRGQISGYDTAMQYLPDQDTGIVVICNRTMSNGPGEGPFDPFPATGWPNNANEVAVYYIINELFPDLVDSSQVTDPGNFSGASVREQRSDISRRSVRTDEIRIRPPLTEY